MHCMGMGDQEAPGLRLSPTFVDIMGSKSAGEKSFPLSLLSLDVLLR